MVESLNGQYFEQNVLFYIVNCSIKGVLPSKMQRTDIC